MKKWITLKRCKKICSLILSALLLMSAVPMSVFAATEIPDVWTGNMELPAGTINGNVVVSGNADVYLTGDLTINGAIILTGNEYLRIASDVSLTEMGKRATLTFGTGNNEVASIQAHGNSDIELYAINVITSPRAPLMRHGGRSFNSRETKISYSEPQKYSKDDPLIIFNENCYADIDVNTQIYADKSAAIENQGRLSTSTSYDTIAKMELQSKNTAYIAGATSKQNTFGNIFITSSSSQYPTVRVRTNNLTFSHTNIKNTAKDGVAISYASNVDAEKIQKSGCTIQGYEAGKKILMDLDSNDDGLEENQKIETKYYKAGYAYTELPWLSHPYYTFEGWSLTFGGECLSIIPYVSTKLYAKWNQNGYAKVNFLAGVAAGKMEPTYLKTGQTVTLPEPDFIPPDRMRFEHWSCNGKAYQPGETVTVNENMHFTAEWIFTGKVNIQFDKGTNGTGTMPTQVSKVGENLILPQCQFQSTGYQWVFDGWKATDGTVYPVGASVPITASTTFTAVWKELPQYTYRHNQTTLEDAIYVIEGDVGSADVIEIKGNVVFLLKDGCSFTTNGVMVKKGNTLTVYSESTQKETMGKWQANGSSYTAAIGGADDMGTVIINGGYITTSSNDQNAGLGTASSTEGGFLTINGGYIDANTSSKGAAIGAGNSGHNFVLTINGGEIHAYAQNAGAAIGGGGYPQQYAHSKNTFIFNGGTIYAETIGDGAAIGTGAGEPNEAYFEFNGGEIHAVSKAFPAAIGSGREKSETAHFTFNGGHIYADKTQKDGDAIGNSSMNSYYNKDSVHMEFKTGNTVIVANTPIQNARHINREGVLGILSEDGGKTFTVCNRALLNEDFTVPADATLTIPKDTELRVLNGTTLTSQNVIQNHGYVTIEEGGTLNGTLLGNAAGNFETVLLKFSSGEAALPYFYRLTLKNAEITLPTASFKNGEQIFSCWNVNGARKASFQKQIAYDDLEFVAEYATDSNPQITGIQILDQADGTVRSADSLFDGILNNYYQRWECPVSAEPFVVFELPEAKAVSRFVLHFLSGSAAKELNFQVLKNEAEYYALSASAQKNYLRDKSNWETIYHVTDNECVNEKTEHVCAVGANVRIYRLNVLQGDRDNGVNATELKVFGTTIRYADVTYEQGTGTGTMPKDSVLMGKTYTLPKCRFEKEHYSFTGWILNHQGEPMATKTNIHISTDITLTATFQENPKVLFDSVEGTAVAPIWSDLLVNGIVVIPETEPTKANWAFAGWTDGYGTYLPGDEYIVGDKDVTLRAIWKLRPILTAQPTLQGFSNQPLKDLSLTGFACNVPGTFRWVNENETLKNGTHTYFASFVPEDVGTYLALPKIAVTVTVKEYAVVSFALDGGSGSMAPMMVEKGTELILPQCDFMAPLGKHFLKWNVGEAGDALVIRGNTVLLPIWQDGIITLDTAQENNTFFTMHSDGRLFVEATGMLQLIQMPFLSYQNNISMVSVAEGTKSLASNAFTAFTSMQYLKLPFTVTTIHEQAFANTNIDTVLVLQGSKADEFVTQKQMKHAYLGELTGDDVVDLADYDKMKKEIIGSGSPLSTEQKLLADCDGDGTIDAFDLSLLKTCNIV